MHTPTIAPTTEFARHDEPDDALQALLQRPALHPAPPVPGGAVLLGTIKSIDTSGLVVLAVEGADLQLTTSVSLVPLADTDIGRTVAFSMPSGSAGPVIVLGLVWQPTPQTEPAARCDATVDGRHVHIEAQESISLSCGRASITLTADGQILLRGDYISNHSTGTQRIKGAAVQIN